MNEEIDLALARRLVREMVLKAHPDDKPAWRMIGKYRRLIREEERRRRENREAA